MPSKCLVIPMLRRWGVAFALAWGIPALALAGPPYISDDPEPTDLGQYEIYFFAMGAAGSQGLELARGVDFNYGAAPNLQLTATLPIVRAEPADQGGVRNGLGNIELAAKYRFLRQDETGWDVAIFPRVFLPSESAAFGDRGTSLFLPIWLEKDWETGWSTFGGGGCELHRGADARNFCLAGWAVTRQLTKTVQLGVELVHQGADAQDSKPSTSAGFGIKIDLDAHFHFLAYAGPGLQNVSPAARYNWYTSLLLTF
jgi:hypothetical protein